jgi:uncharacterized membrane protein
MPELLIITFEHEEDAEQVRAALRKMPREELLRIEDALTLQGAGLKTLRFESLRRRSSPLLAVPKALAASAFAGIYFAAAWTVATGTVLASALQRARKPLRRAAAMDLQDHVGDAASALVLIVKDQENRELLAQIERLAANQEPSALLTPEASTSRRVMHTPISTENVARLRQDLRMARKAAESDKRND